ncbi:hypothetical protein [Bradyrhizobium sp. PRIMUS42]|uniref:hypothetical protein n=1 Tax=Bradyrhizobium sp. PRIMUS42 TaxID=2908926 RepID=UPI001FF35EDC|nr:hypothetical protein [Bradyrhizobium sp. PRIMUS42]MCJ9730400.1 hypothetical protein [Bradyrhizobium sp. PRIMUS42]
MGRRYPYPRFLQLKLTPLEQLRYVIRYPGRKLRAKLDRLWYSKFVYRWVGGPLHDRKYAPWVPYSPEAKAPVVIDPSRPRCRTRHGNAVVYWMRLGATLHPNHARAALQPDGTRGNVQNRTMGWWRREGRSHKLWIIGDVDIRADDVVFIDAVSQDLIYDAPPADSSDLLERELATHPPFVDALANDKFAAVAHSMLMHLDWIRTGTREAGTFDSLHHMIACLRNKGEDYLDYKFGDYPVTLTDSERIAHTERMREIMHSLGWRTYTADELKARMREDFRIRVGRRVEAWRRLDDLEARPAGSHDVLAKTPPIMDMPLYQGDEAEWLKTLGQEERIAISSQFVQRIKDLANTGRLTPREFEELSRFLI